MNKSTRKVRKRSRSVQRRSRSAGKVRRRSRSGIRRSRSAGKVRRRSRYGRRRSRSADKVRRRSRSGRKRSSSARRRSRSRSKSVNKISTDLKVAYTLNTCINKGLNSEECMMALKNIKKDTKHLISKYENKQIFKNILKDKFPLFEYKKGPTIEIIKPAYPKPEYWPASEKWPLPEGIRIVGIYESLPPVFELSNGRKIRGVKEIPINFVEKPKPVEKEDKITDSIQNLKEATENKEEKDKKLESLKEEIKELKDNKKPSEEIKEKEKELEVVKADLEVLNKVEEVEKTIVEVVKASEEVKEAEKEVKEIEIKVSTIVDENIKKDELKKLANAKSVLAEAAKNFKNKKTEKDKKLKEAEEEAKKALKANNYNDIIKQITPVALYKAYLNYGEEIKNEELNLKNALKSEINLLEDIILKFEKIEEQNKRQEKIVKIFNEDYKKWITGDVSDKEVKDAEDLIKEISAPLKIQGRYGQGNYIYPNYKKLEDIYQCYLKERLDMQEFKLLLILLNKQNMSTETLNRTLKALTGYIIKEDNEANENYCQDDYKKYENRGEYGDYDWSGRWVSYTKEDYDDFLKKNNNKKSGDIDNELKLDEDIVRKIKDIEDM